MTSAATPVAAVDLGATSGRVILGHVSSTELRLTPVARFVNQPVRTSDGLHWDLLHLYGSVLAGLASAVRDEPEVASVAVDSWAVDYGLLRGGRLLGVPYHYRDERTALGVQRVHQAISPEELYARNGLQFLPFNTLYQWEVERDSLLDLAEHALLVPDLIGYWLGGSVVAERTNASTTGLVNVHDGRWDEELISRLDLPRGILPELVQPGTALTGLRPGVAAELGRELEVIAIGSHDTASAVVAVPATEPDFAYISCGTWALVGVELEAPVVSEASRVARFTNEGGVDGRVRYLHNVMGLWLLSESVRSWERDGERIDLPALLAEAAAVTTPVAVFDPDDERFLAPGDLPARIAELCRERGLPVPNSRAEFVRSILESLADAFGRTVRTAQQLTGKAVSVIHIVGGGSQNELLCQLTADRAGLPVLAGPVEATALGNVLVQARSRGIVHGDLESLRALVARAFPPQRYLPRPGVHG